MRASFMRTLPDFAPCGRALVISVMFECPALQHIATPLEISSGTRARPSLCAARPAQRSKAFAHEGAGKIAGEVRLRHLVCVPEGAGCRPGRRSPFGIIAGLVRA